MVPYFRKKRYPYHFVKALSFSFRPEQTGPASVFFLRSDTDLFDNWKRLAYSLFAPLCFRKTAVCRGRAVVGQNG
jgi:hypothetical protein